MMSLDYDHILTVSVGKIIGSRGKAHPKPNLHKTLLVMNVIYKAKRCRAAQVGIACCNMASRQLDPISSGVNPDVPFEAEDSIVPVCDKRTDRDEQITESYNRKGVDQNCAPQRLDTDMLERRSPSRLTDFAILVSPVSQLPSPSSSALSSSRCDDEAPDANDLATVRGKARLTKRKLPVSTEECGSQEVNDAGDCRARPDTKSLSDTDSSGVPIKRSRLQEGLTLFCIPLGGTTLLPTVATGVTQLNMLWNKAFTVSPVTLLELLDRLKRGAGEVSNGFSQPASSVDIPGSDHVGAVPFTAQCRLLQQQLSFALPLQCR